MLLPMEMLVFPHLYPVQDGSMILTMPCVKHIGRVRMGWRVHEVLFLNERGRLPSLLVPPRWIKLSRCFRLWCRGLERHGPEKV